MCRTWCEDLASAGWARERYAPFRRRRAKGENHLTKLGQEQRRHGAGNDASAAAGEWGSADRDGGNRSQEIMVASGLRRAADKPCQQQSRHRKAHPGGDIGANLVQ